MKIILTAIFLFSLSSFSYDVVCKASRYLTSYDLIISNIDNRDGRLTLKRKSHTIIDKPVKLVNDLIDGDKYLVIESFDMSVSGYLSVILSEGDLEVKNKSYNISQCKYVR